MKNILIFSGMAILLFLIFKFMNGGVKAVDKTQVLKMIQEGALVIDVRSPEEFASGHYQNAINIPVDQVQSRIKEFGNPDTKIVLYCRSGGRAGSAKGVLDSKGFKNVVNAGGLSDMPK